MQDQDPQANDQPQPEKRPYVRPEIIDYGSVRDLTRGAGTKSFTDMHSGQRRVN